MCTCVCKILFIQETTYQPYWKTIVICLDNLYHQINIKIGYVELKVRHIFKSGVSPFTVSIIGGAFAHTTLRQDYLGICQRLL